MSCMQDAEKQEKDEMDKADQERKQLECKLDEVTTQEAMLQAKVCLHNNSEQY